MPLTPPLHEAQTLIIDQLLLIQHLLVRCVEEGMIDTDSYHYNEVLDLLEEAKIAETKMELSEVVAKGKMLEVDIAAWLSRIGRTTISLTWPKF